MGHFMVHLFRLGVGALYRYHGGTIMKSLMKDHMNKYKSLIFTLLATAIIVGALVGIFYITDNSGSGAASEDANGLTALATCLSERGAKFYGSFACSHCQAQKKDFGDAAKSLPYVECTTPDGRGQTQACADAQIVAYPTWVFGDGQRVEGRVALASLAEATGCPAPAQAAE